MRRIGISLGLFALATLAGASLMTWQALAAKPHAGEMLKACASGPCVMVAR
jgi:hypothetical protein